MKNVSQLKRILFLVPGPEMGGVATAFLALVNALEQSGYLVQVVLPYETDIKKSVIPSKYVLGAIFKKRLKNRFLLRCLNLFNLLTRWNFYFLFAKRFKYDYDSFGIYQGMSYSHWIKYSKAKFNIAWFHGEVNNPANSLWKKSHSFYYNKFDALIAITDKIVDGWKTKYAIKKEIYVINNLLNLNEIIRQSAKQQYEIVLSNRPKFIFVARFSKEKGVFRLLSTIVTYVKQGAEFDIFFIGDGPLRIAMEEFIKKYKLDV